VFSVDVGEGLDGGIMFGEPFTKSTDGQLELDDRGRTIGQTTGTQPTVGDRLHAEWHSRRRRVGRHDLPRLDGHLPTMKQHDL